MLTNAIVYGTFGSLSKTFNPQLVYFTNCQLLWIKTNNFRFAKRRTFVTMKIHLSIYWSVKDLEDKAEDNLDRPPTNHRAELCTHSHTIDNLSVAKHGFELGRKLEKMLTFLKYTWFIYTWWRQELNPKCTVAGQAQ